MLTTGSYLKRFIDIVFGSVALVVLVPVVAFAGLAILLEDGRPVFFRQERSGLLGKTFRILKLRSMTLHQERPEQLGQIHGAHPLVTRVGRVIRRWKIDEMPQLVNLLRGDVSLVGPRPTLLEQAEAYTPLERRRLEVRPGLTGWAQVNGGVELSWTTRIALDVWYIDHWTFWLDVRILLKTPMVVLRGERRCEKAVQAAEEYWPLANTTKRRSSSLA